MGFDISKYEDVHSRKERFKKLYPTSRVIKKVLAHDIPHGWILVETALFLRYEDELPSAVDIALGERDTYPASMRKFFAEDTSTSSEGRAYDLVLETNARATKEDMEKVNRFEERVKSMTKEKIQVEMPSDPWTIQVKDMPLPVSEAVTALNEGIQPEEIPMCKHGAMSLKEGIGKTNKPYHGYICNGYLATGGDSQCPPIWYNLNKAGQWKPQSVSAQQGVMY